MSMLNEFQTQSNGRIITGINPKQMIIIGASTTNEDPCEVEITEKEAAHIAWSLIANLKLRKAAIRQPLLDEFHEAVRKLL